MDSPHLRLPSLLALCCSLTALSCATAPRAAELPRFPVPAGGSLDDPAALGPYAPARFLYASPDNPRRPEYRDARVATSTFDLRPFYDKVEKAYWGFGSDSVPLNGVVWYPASVAATGGPAAGPFPLIVCVHGNHEPRDPSEFGYDYLGEVLASRGYVFASIDENFLNGNSKGENDARGILLLEHARLILGWNGQAGNPLEGRIDGTGLVLVGHSRGGEAVVHAATFNGLSLYPEDAGVTLDYGLPIRGLVSIAPAEGQYRPAGRRFFPSGVDYLSIQGSLDGDVIPYMGLHFYNRHRPGPEGFKASLWIQGANHAQFNASWSKDQDPSPTFRASLITAQDQRTAVLAAIAAFAEASLGGDSEYREFFSAPGLAETLLPAGDYRIQSAQGQDLVLASFDDDADPGSADLRGWTIRAKGFATARETEQRIIPEGERKAKLLSLAGVENGVESWNLELKSGAKEDAARRPKKDDTAAKESGPPVLRLEGPAAAAAALRFDIAARAWKAPEGGAVRGAVVALATDDGRVLEAPLADFFQPSPPRRQWLVFGGSAPRDIFETVEIPFDRFAGYGGQAIQAVELRFGEGAEFDLALDNFAFRTRGERR